VTEYRTKEEFFAAIKRAQAGDKQTMAEVRSFADNPRRREQAIRASASGSRDPQPRPRSAPPSMRAGSQVSDLKAKAADARRRAS
jgi:hypothetical protein